MLVTHFYYHLFPLVMIAGRITGLFMFIPVFGSNLVPMQSRAVFVFLLAVVLHLGGDIGMEQMNIGPMEAAYGILFEFLAGAAMGLILVIFFAAISYAGDIVAPQMGMAISQLVDPQTQQMQPVLSTFLNFIAVIFFLSINGHLLVIQGMADSYRLLPLGGFHMTGGLIEALLEQGGQVFILGLKICSPVLAVIMFLNTGMAIMARAVPQVHVIVVGFIITISVGILTLISILPAFEPIFDELMHDAVERMMWLLKTM